MPRQMDDETHFPVNDTEYKAAIEESIPREEPYSFDEFNVDCVTVHDEETKRRSLKNRMMKPVIALIMTFPPRESILSVFSI